MLTQCLFRFSCSFRLGIAAVARLPGAIVAHADAQTGARVVRTPVVRSDAQRMTGCCPGCTFLCSDLAAMVAHLLAMAGH